MRHIILCWIFALLATAMSRTNYDEMMKSLNDQIASRMLQNAAKKKINASFVLSPFSVLHQFGLLAAATVGASHKEILNAISFHNITETRAAFINMNNKLQKIRKFKVKLSNKIYIDNGYSLSGNFTSTANRVYNADIQRIDLGNKQKSASEISKWVEKNLKRLVKDLFTADSISDTAGAIFVNAVYFRGKWVKPFKANNNKHLNFFVSSNKSRRWPTMVQTERFHFGKSKELDAKLLKLRYKRDATSLLLILPNKLDGIHELIKKLNDPTLLDKAEQAMHNAKVKVRIPIFRTRSTRTLNSVIKDMNIKQIFEKGKAQLDNIVNGNSSKLYLQSATQTTLIEIYEKGTERASASWFNIDFKVSGNVEEFYANHPFVFYLIGSGYTLFCGVFAA